MSGERELKNVARGKHHRRTLFLLIKILISASLIVLLTRYISFREVFHVMRGSKIGLVVIAVLLCNGLMLLGARRWQLLLNALDYHPAYLDIVRRVYICLFFNVFIPGNLAGEVVRTVSLARGSGKSTESGDGDVGGVAASVATDRAVGLLALILLALGGTLLWFKEILDPRIVRSIYGFAAVFALMALFLLSGPGQRVLEYCLTRLLGHFPQLLATGKQFINVYRIYRRNPVVLLKALSLSLCAQLLSIYGFYLLVRSLGLNIGYLKMLTFAPIIIIVSCMPMSVSGIGVREAITVLLFGRAGIGQEEAVAASLLFFITQIIIAASGGIAYLLPAPKSGKPHPENSQ